MEFNYDLQIGSLRCICRDCIFMRETGLVKPKKCLSDADCNRGECEDCHCYIIRCNDVTPYFPSQFKCPTPLKEEEMVSDSHGNEEWDSALKNALFELKKQVENFTKSQTYSFSNGESFNPSDMYPLKTINRFPTSREVKDFILERIRWDMLGKDINVWQYRSLKGEIRRGHWTGPVHFLRKFDSGKDILKQTIDYMLNKKTVGKATVTFPEPVKSEIIEIEVNKMEE